MAVDVSKAEALSSKVSLFIVLLQVALLQAQGLYTFSSSHSRQGRTVASMLRQNAITVLHSL